MEIPPSELEFAVLIGGKYRFLTSEHRSYLVALFLLLYPTFKYFLYVCCRVKFGSKNGLLLVKA